MCSAACVQGMIEGARYLVIHHPDTQCRMPYGLENDNYVDTLIEKTAKNKESVDQAAVL